jgi:hypothetical protein
MTTSPDRTTVQTAMQRQQLEGLSREELVERAERLGVPRPRVLTHPELMDEILARSTKSARDRARARGWLGRARDLVAGVIERGLHLPDVAKALRATPSDKVWPEPPPPLPTITLAEIYAAQGHLDRAVGVLDEVLAREPQHVEAESLRKRFADQASRPKSVRPQARHSAANHAATPVAASSAGERTGTGAREVARAAERVAGEAAPPRVVAMSGQGDQRTKPPAAQVPRPAATPLTPAVTPPAAAAPADERVAKAANHTGAAATEVPDTAAGRQDSVPPLPERYDVDEVVAIAVDPSTIYVYWEVRPTTMARARARRPEGQLALRVVSVTPSWDGPLAQTRDLRIDPLFGDLFVRDLPPGANVRVSIGWLASTNRDAGTDAHEVAVVADGDFEPFAVGLEINAPRAMPTETPARGVAVWSPSPGGSAPLVPQSPSPWASPRAGSPAVAARARRRMEAAAPGTGGTTAQPAPATRESVRQLPAARRSWLVQRGGSSEMYSEEELGNRWIGDRWGGASELGRGGASEMSRGGASNLARPGGSSGSPRR